MKIMNKGLGWQTLLELQSVSVQVYFSSWRSTEVKVKMHAKSLHPSCTVHDCEIRCTNPVAPDGFHWGSVPRNARDPSCLRRGSRPCRRTGQLAGADSLALPVAPSVAPSRIFQIAVNTSGSGAVSLQAVNQMDFAFLDIFLRCLVFKLLEAIHRTCRGQVLL